MGVKVCHVDVGTYAVSVRHYSADENI